MDLVGGIAAGLAGLLPCFFFGGVAAIIISLVVWGIIRSRRRRDDLARLAAELGFEFYADDPWDLPARYAGMDLFGIGHSHRASNVMAGRVDGRSVLAFDYQYTTGSGKNSHTYYFQATVFGTPIEAPRLSLRKENLLDTLASWVGHDDLDFESEEFSKRYFVKCEDRKFAYDIFHARLIEYLLACGEAPAMEMTGPLLLLHDKQGGPEQVRRLLAIGGEILRSIPDYVLHERGIGDRAGGPA